MEKSPFLRRLWATLCCVIVKIKDKEQKRRWLRSRQNCGYFFLECLNYKSVVNPDMITKLVQSLRIHKLDNSSSPGRQWLQVV